MQQADLGDGSIAFIESSAEVSEEGAVGFIKATDEIVSFVGHGDPTGMDPGVVAAMNVQQVSRIFEVVEGGAVTPAVEDLEAALLVPDDLGGEFDETLTSIDPALDFMCFGEPRGGRLGRGPCRQRAAGVRPALGGLRRGVGVSGRGDCLVVHQRHSVLPDVEPRGRLQPLRTAHRGARRRGRLRFRDRLRR